MSGRPAFRDLLGERRAALGWLVVAAILFLGATGNLYGEVWRRGPSVFVPIPPDQVEHDWFRITQMDYEVVVARVAHNARKLVRAPWRLAEGEQCHPTKSALALGDPMIATGLLGTPGYLATGDPVVTYNVALAAMAIGSATAMTALVWSWTGVPAAAIGAGIVFGFNWARVRDVAHPFIFDHLWTVLAMGFAWRFFRGGRTRDALALGACGVLQMAESSYAVLGAGVIALPYAAWLLVRARGVPNVRGALAGVAVLAVGAFLIYRPYLELLPPEGSVGLQAFAAWRQLVPWRVVGWPATVLLAVALVTPARWGVCAGVWDPRPALAIGGVLLVWVASGGGAGEWWDAVTQGREPPPLLPNPYGWLAGIIPGLASVRAPMYLGGGLQAIFAPLVGLGAAALVRSVPGRWGGALGVALLGLLWVQTVRPGWLGFEALPRMAVHRIRPADEVLAFYAQLDALGDRGPVLELPAHQRGLSSRQILLAAYHRRPTSACYMSVIPASYDEVIALARDLPSEASVHGARRLGFTTIVLRTHGFPMARLRKDEFDRAASSEAAPLRLLHQTPEFSAYAIPTESEPDGA